MPLRWERDACDLGEQRGAAVRVRPSRGSWVGILARGALGFCGGCLEWAAVLVEQRAVHVRGAAYRVELLSRAGPRERLDARGGRRRESGGCVALRVPLWRPVGARELRPARRRDSLRLGRSVARASATRGLSECAAVHDERGQLHVLPEPEREQFQSRRWAGSRWHSRAPVRLRP